MGYNYDNKNDAQVVLRHEGAEAKVTSFSRERRWSVLPFMAVLGLLAVLLPQVEATGTRIPTPAEIIGFEPGTDRTLVDYDQLIRYYKILDGASDRVLLKPVGTSTEGRTLYLLFISSPQNLMRLDAIQAVQQRLADPRTLPPDEARQLITDQPAVVFINNAIHSTEIAAPHFALQLAYHLAASDDPETLRILADVVLLMNPVNNPDGHDLVVRWYRQTLGTPYEGTNPPELYQHYAGHDNNRDWFMFNLQETRVWGPIIFREWLPNIIWDVHQMGSGGARFFVPPFFDPPNPEIDATILTQITLLGGAITTRLAEKGLTGVVTNAIYDQWWHGGFRTAPYYHNLVGILTEAASSRLATPIDIPFDELGGHARGLPTAQQRYVNFPQPWPGGTWRLSDIMRYEYETALAILDTAQRHREQWHWLFYERNRRAVERGLVEAPYAFIISLDQHDPGTARWLLDVLAFQGVEIHMATEPLVVDGREYPAGSTYVILAAQPKRPNVMALLLPQSYPPRFQYPGGPPEAPYDIAGWTLPMQMGVHVDVIQEPLDTSSLVRVETVPPLRGSVRGEKATFGYALRPEANAAAVARNRLLALGYQLWQLDGEATVGSTVLPPGTTLIPQSEHLDQVVAELAWELGLDFLALEAQPVASARRLNRPRVGLYESWQPNMDAGWTRWLLDTFEFEYEVLRDADIREGDLETRFDIVILPDQSVSGILQGHRPGAYPEEYVGGLGDEGLRALRAFVEAGGTLLLFDTASQLAIEHLQVPVRDVLDGVGRDQFYVPGSILHLQVDPSHPLAYGMSPRTYAYFVHSPAFEVLGDARPVATWPAEEELLASGWLHGGELIAGRAALVAAPIGEGRAILVGFRAQHRGQSHATFKLIFNAIFDSAAGDSE